VAGAPKEIAFAQSDVAGVFGVNGLDAIFNQATDNELPVKGCNPLLETDSLPSPLVRPIVQLLHDRTRNGGIERLQRKNLLVEGLLVAAVG
jgi:hypothetical protein